MTAQPTTAGVRELVVISGKGGTGKTSLTACFATLAENPVLADCDVDAADLHIVLQPEVRERHDFYSGREAVIDQEKCIACGACLANCRYDAIRTDGRPAGEAEFAVDPIACEGCGVCVRFCPVDAIAFPEALRGEWMISDTRRGPMVHAHLTGAGENSGKLVTTVRERARAIAEAAGRPLVLVDGPPGIGCPVIASITGASRLLAVTEPSVSGEHDLERVLGLARHFGVPVDICVNKWNVNEEVTDRIERNAREAGARPVGRVRYDPAVTKAQMQGLSAVETDAPSAADIHKVWEAVQAAIAVGRVKT